MKPPARSVEASLFASYWDDGLLDLLSGAGVVAIGIGWLSDLFVLAAIVPVLLVPLWSPLRQRLVETRAGYVEFSAARRHRTTTGLHLTLFLGVATFFLAAAAAFAWRTAAQPPDLERMVSGLPAALLALAAFLAAALTGARRFFVYGLLLLLGGAATISLDLDPAAPMLATGAFVSIAGVVLLFRFLHTANARASGG